MISDVFQPANIMFLLQGFKVTLEIGFFSIIFSVIGGTFLGVCRYLKLPVISTLAGIYIDIMRNLPFLLLVLVVRFMTPLPPVMSGIAAMSIFTAATMSEVVRGGLNAIPNGQFEAAYSQGMTRFQVLRFIVLPQSFRNIIPPMMSEFTTIIKDSSYVWAVGTEELTGRGMILIGKYSATGQLFTIFACVALIYFVLNYTLSSLARWKYKQMRAYIH
ncbi:amino acid ABC transporter permease [Megasphaera paucivorans]|uniref:Amino acid ABC transporter membrane protein 2, PAAT family (TC 3.A.1.3.-) n=1 Tax=Megasphaera paucivorans TaxID=349095 RepID=A0A1G9TNA5_9FIRM|nr:amino acid ABC transporter permease [Megasphaera paucivorans]SDM49256.1 amino acid ABC transporter membrane protein 2, PAAT family (TC 3.A.1.3.-) [Megasphaera paucivorans]